MTARKICRFVRKNENSNWKKRQPNFFLEQKVCAIVGMCIKQCPLLVWGDRQQVNGGITNGFSNYLFHFQTTRSQLSDFVMIKWTVRKISKLTTTENVMLDKGAIEYELVAWGKSPILLDSLFLLDPLWTCQQESSVGNLVLNHTCMVSLLDVPFGRIQFTFVKLMLQSHWNDSVPIFDISHGLCKLGLLFR